MFLMSGALDVFVIMITSLGARYLRSRLTGGRHDVGVLIMTTLKYRVMNGKRWSSSDLKRILQLKFRFPT